MKKIIFSFLITCVSFLSLIFFLSSTMLGNKGEFQVALITDFVDVNDGSFTQSCYEGVKEWSKANNIKYNYYKPLSPTNAERIKSMNIAIDRGYNVIICPGYAFGSCLSVVAPKNPNVKFIGIDIAKSDFPDNFEITDNISIFNYHEEIAGFLAGYAIVKEGFSRLGFVGGMAASAVTRYGYGFIQGADSAAIEERVNVEIQFVYAGQYYGDVEIYKYADNLYKVNDVEVIFSCGGGIYTSIALAAKENEGYMIGVDTDQAPVIDRDYKPGICITSATKSMKQTIIDKLDVLYKENKWDQGINYLGLVSSDNLEANYVQLPIKTWRMKNFSINDYTKLVKEILNGERNISSIIDKAPTTSEFTKVFYKGSIK